MKTAIRTFEEFRDALSAYRLPRVMLTALDLNLFTVIGKKTWLLPELAREIKVSERGLSILCRNLAMVGLLHKKGMQYRNSRLAATTLNADDPAYREDRLALTARMLSWRMEHDERVLTGMHLTRNGVFERRSVR